MTPDTSTDRRPKNWKRSFSSAIHRFKSKANIFEKIGAKIFQADISATLFYAPRAKNLRQKRFVSNLTPT